MTHVFLATDLLAGLATGIILIAVFFMIVRAASTGDLRIHRHRRSFWRRDDSNLSVFGQTGLLDHFTDNQTSASTSNDDLSIYRSHDNVSNISAPISNDDFGSKSSDLSDWSTGGHFGDSGGSLGGSFADSLNDNSSSFGDSSGGLGSSLGDSFSDSGSSFSDNCSGDSVSSDN